MVLSGRPERVWPVGPIRLAGHRDNSGSQLPIFTRKRSEGVAGTRLAFASDWHPVQESSQATMVVQVRGFAGFRKFLPGASCIPFDTLVTLRKL